MKKRLIFFFLSIALSLLAASHRWNDSAHAITTVSNKGGSVRHAVRLEGGGDRYTIIVTGRVVPPYRGDIKIKLEGKTEIPYEIRSSLPPKINLGVHKWYSVEGDMIKGVKPKDKFVLWLILRPNPVDPVCSMEGQKELREFHEGKEYHFCSKECKETFNGSPEKFKDNDYIRGKYELAFYDTKQNKPVMKLPIIFKGKGEKETVGPGRHH